MATILSLPVDRLPVGIANEIEALTSCIQRNESKIEKLQAEQAEDAREASKQSKNVERYWSKKLLLQQRRDECNNNIRSLGVLPEEAFEKYIRYRTEKVELHLCSATLITSGNEGSECLPFPVAQILAKSDGILKEIFTCQQKSH